MNLQLFKLVLEKAEEPEITESGKEGTYQVLAHHVSPMQEQQFDDFVAIEPHSIMQGAVPFLEPV